GSRPTRFPHAPTGPHPLYPIPQEGTQMAVGAYVTVPAPARQPHRYGLFSAATIVDTTTPHEQMGVQWSPLPCDRPDYWPHDCPTPPDATKTPTTQPPTQHALPITIYGSFECRLVGYSITEATAR